MRKKEVLARALAGTGFTRWRARNNHGSNPVTILAYHRVLDYQDANYWHDVELISATPDVFESQMRYLAENYSPVTLSQYVDALDGKYELPPRPVLVTFDDGHIDNYEVAFPILKRHGVPAAIFLSTAYIDSGEPFWFDQVSAWIHRLDGLALEELGIAKRDISGSLPVRRKLSADYLEMLKELSDADRQDRVAKLKDRADVQGIELNREWARPMNWSQVNEMIAGGMEFGSHTVTHPVLSRLSDDRQALELTLSRQRIMDMTQKAARVLAYPVGGRQDYTESTTRLARQAGYEAAMAYVSGVTRTPGSCRYYLPRLHVERYTSRAWFEAMLCCPDLFTG